MVIAYLSILGVALVFWAVSIGLLIWTTLK